MDTQAQFPFVSGQLTRLLTDIGVAAKIVNHQVNRAGLAGILGASVPKHPRRRPAETRCFCRPDVHAHPDRGQIGCRHWLGRTRKLHPVR